MTPAEQARAEVEAWFRRDLGMTPYGSWPAYLEKLITHLTPVFERARDGIGTVMQDVAKENLERAERAEAECDSIMAQLREAMIDLEEGSTDRQAAEDMQNLASKYMDERDALTARLALVEAGAAQAKDALVWAELLSHTIEGSHAVQMQGRMLGVMHLRVIFSDALKALASPCLQNLGKEG